MHIVEAGRKRVFDVEMQTSDTRNLPKRSRYYLSQMDQETLRRGHHYDELPATFVIFICTFDIVGTGRHVYTVKPHYIEEPDCEFDDGTTRIFLNAKGTQNDCSPKLKAFLDYVNGKMSDDPYVQKLDKAVGQSRHKGQNKIKMEARIHEPVYAGFGEEERGHS